MNDIRTALDLSPADAEAAGPELVMAGLVTNDSLDALRRMVGGEIVTPAMQQARQRPVSAAGGAACRTVGRPPRTQASSGSDAPQSLRASGIQPQPPRLPLPNSARGERLVQEQEATEHAATEGRWTLVHALACWANRCRPLNRPPSRPANRWLRHGVVTREKPIRRVWRLGMVSHLSGIAAAGTAWRNSPRSLCAVAARPSICLARSGGAAARRRLLGADDAPVLLNACDPANLYGPALEDGPLTANGEPLAFGTHSVHLAGAAARFSCFAD
ncbi:MAG: hypothetical protein R2911_20760 [Caldilineaceae bacterium]